MKKIISVLAVVGLASAGVIPVPVAPLVGHVATQYHAQDELGQYSYGYAGGPSAKEEIKTVDGITRGGYSYVDGNGLVQSAAYVSDPVNGFRVAATNLPVGPAVPSDPQVLAVAPNAPAPVVQAVSVQSVAEPVAVQTLPSTLIQSAVTRVAIQQEAPAQAAAPAPVVEQPAEQPAEAEAPSAEEQTKSEEEPAAEVPAAPTVVIPETTIQQLVTPVQDTPEVQAAKAAHLAAVEETKLRDAAQEAKDAQENGISGEGEEEKSEEGVEPTEASAEGTESPASESETQAAAAAPSESSGAVESSQVQQAQPSILPSVVATELVPAPVPAAVPVASPALSARIVPSVLAKEVVAAQPAVAVAPAPVAAVPVAAVPAAVPAATVPGSVSVVAIPAPAPSAVLVGAPVAPSPSGPVALEHVGQITSQYHAQDELGQYTYGYSGGPSAKHEVKTADGLTSGGFSYIDSHGLVQSAAYVSDPVNGFRVAATNIPKQREPEYIPDSPEVEEAKQKLFQAQAEHIAKL